MTVLVITAIHFSETNELLHWSEAKGLCNQNLDLHHATVFLHATDVIISLLTFFLSVFYTIRYILYQNLQTNKDSNDPELIALTKMTWFVNQKNWIISLLSYHDLNKNVLSSRQVFELINREWSINSIQANIQLFKHFNHTNSLTNAKVYQKWFHWSNAINASSYLSILPYNQFM